MILMIDITFLIVIYSFMTSFRIFRYLQLKNLEVVKWQREYTQSQFEAMKNQLNPHFLFNSLNALSSLVYVNADLAETFIEKLSRSYRYLLEQRDKTTVPLSQELQFLNSFLFLIEQRFGNKLQVQLQEIQAANFYLPPHTLMILLEYIIQTNSMSAANPLVLILKEKEESMVLTYQEQLKPGNAPEEADSQLSRLKDEFQYLLGKPLVKSNEGNQATVTIPLLYK
jgi:two-component system, LytTR family, sensor kinase